MSYKCSADGGKKSDKKTEKHEEHKDEKKSDKKTEKKSDSKEEKKDDVIDEQILQLRKVLKTPLEDLDLSVRAFNCLKAAKINSLSELVQYEQEDLMKFRNFGQKSLSEIEQVLIERGLSFGLDLQKMGLDHLD